MFIETLEFTIPMDLCDLFSTMKRGPSSNLEFPASVNSYGTTQDANIQVVVRSNKLTFKVDGVSSDASMISKSECKTLKLSVFDVDRSLMPFEEESYDNSISNQYSSPMSGPSKRSYEQSVSVPPAKVSKTSSSYHNDSPRPRSPHHRKSPPRRSQNYVSPRPSENSQSKSQNDTPVNVKQEPEDPDLIEIEPDDIEPKKEEPFMQIDYSSDVPHTQTSQQALHSRLSHPQSSHSQSPGSSSSSFHQNVPHVQNYSEPGPSQRHGDQSADDFLVFQDDDGEDNEADYSNDESQARRQGQGWKRGGYSANQMDVSLVDDTTQQSRAGYTCVFQDCRILFEDSQECQNHILTSHINDQSYSCRGCGKLFLQETNLAGHSSSCTSLLDSLKKTVTCEICGKQFASKQKKNYHINSIHRGITYTCECGQTYAYQTGLDRHRKQTGHFPSNATNKVEQFSFGRNLNPRF